MHKKETRVGAFLSRLARANFRISPLRLILGLIEFTGWVWFVVLTGLVGVGVGAVLKAMFGV